jgi:uncharacterized protein (TIGR03437 family)
MRWCLLLALAVAPMWAAPGRHNLELVGQLPLGPGFNAGVWVHGNAAYVGTWGNAAYCPALGVKIVDLSDPASPRLLGRAASYPNTSAEAMVVRRLDSSAFRGDLLAVGLQSCRDAQPARRGVELIDASDPANPRTLSFFDTGSESRGVHELDLVVRDDGRAFLLLATLARFRLVEVTDPSRPRQISDWTLASLGETPSSSKFVHSAVASADGRVAFLSYWDAGVILLDISEPSNPRYLGRTGFGPRDEGNAHSAAVSRDRRTLLTADEVLDPGNASSGFRDWGFLRVFDISDSSLPRQIGSFLTANARTDPVKGPAGSGAYSIRTPRLSGELGYLAWYSDGVRVVDLVNRRRPLEVGFYVPPDNVDPFGAFPSKAEVWDVALQAERNLIVASDINFGLYLLRAVEPKPSRAVNAADSREGQPVAPGSIVTLYGQDLAGASDIAFSTPLPVQLAGAAVRVNGAPARLFYAGPGQINFLLPEETEIGTARVTVENLGRASQELDVTVAETAPGLFTAGGKVAARRARDHSPVTQAQAGEVIELYATGLGRLASTSTVTVGGQTAELIYAGPAPGYAGLYQLNIRIPGGVQGDVEVVLSVAGRFSNPALLTIE